MLPLFVQVRHRDPFGVAAFSGCPIATEQFWSLRVVFSPRLIIVVRRPDRPARPPARAFVAELPLTFNNDTVTVISDTFINPLSAPRTAWKDRMDRFDGSIIGATEAQRYERAKQTARDHGFILLTPRACAYLYDVSPNTLRAGVEQGGGRDPR